MENGTEPYRVRAAVGDRVRMKDGTVAVIKDDDIIMGGHVKVVFLKPEGVHPLKRFWCFLLGRYRLYEDQIDELEFIEKTGSPTDSQPDSPNPLS